MPDDSEKIIVNGQAYSATNINTGILWMVTWYTTAQLDPLEAEVYINTQDPMEAIKAAIQNGSWS